VCAPRSLGVGVVRRLSRACRGVLLFLVLIVPALDGWAAPSVGRVWLELGPDTLTPQHARELERLLAHGLRRRDLELTPHSDGQAIWVVQVRAIAAELYVLVVSGPALPGSGVSKSRRIDTAGLGADVLPLSVAQAAEELLDAARSPTPPSPTRTAPLALDPSPAIDAAALRPTPSPAAGAGAPWSLDLVALGAMDTYSSGLMAVGGGLGAHLARGRWGLEARVGFARLLPEVGTLGRIAGQSLGLALGPRLTFEPAESLRLGLGVSAEARWLFAGGSEPVEGLAGAEGRGWAWLALGAGTVQWQLSDDVHLHGRASVGPVVRGVRFAGLGEALGGATGVVASFALGLGVGLW